jgi:integrase
MPKKAPILTPYQIKRLSTPGLYAVGGVTGLHLRVKPTGARSWILRVVIGDRRPDIGLGGYPDVSLEQARARAREVREQVWEGIDPLAARKAAKNVLRAEQAKRPSVEQTKHLTFDQAAVQCWRARSQEFKNHKHAAQWLSTLKQYASPVIGSLPVDQIDATNVAAALKPIWTAKTETASRLRGRIETVLNWAKTSGYRSGENLATWDTLKHLLPRPSKLRKTRNHHPALPWQLAPQFMAALREQLGLAPRALEFAILTAARSQEVRLATWDEIDFVNRVWTVPAEHMKGGLVHRVPLSGPAVQLLQALPITQGSQLIFPAPRGGALSDTSLSEVCRDLHAVSVKAGGVGWLDAKQKRIATPHRFRSSFKDWCRAKQTCADEVSELALAHVNSDETRAAYARDELLSLRVRLMRRWGLYCLDGSRKSAVAATDASPEMSAEKDADWPST